MRKLYKFNLIKEKELQTGSFNTISLKKGNESVDLLT